MRLPSRLVGAVASAAALLMLSGCEYQPERINPPRGVETSETSQPTETRRPLASEPVSVVRPSDGDTIRVREEDGDVKSVRVIGINTPETVDPNREVQCYGPQASAEAKRILKPGLKVILVFDASQGRFDRYKRTLAYIQVPGVGDYGLHMVREGFAKEYTYSRAYARQKAYRAAQRAAQEEKDGLWGQCLAAGRPR